MSSASSAPTLAASGPHTEREPDAAGPRLGSADAESAETAAATHAPAEGKPAEEDGAEASSQCVPNAPIDLTTVDFSDAAAAGSSSPLEPPKDRAAAAQHKATGNKHFGAREFSDAIEAYSLALDAAPLDTPQDHKDASVYYANRAAAFMGMSAWDDAARDCSDALELQPEYVKARLRRAHAYEKSDKLDEALSDYKRLLELQPGMPEAERSVPRLERAIAARDEALKAEMMGKLKDLGNSILGNFGLSTDNFQFKQDPSTGGYNINFVQNADKGAGK